jgi:acetyl-CoA acetyltransferase
MNNHVAAALQSVGIVGIYQTKQARQLPGQTSESLLAEAVVGALADAGLTIADADGFTVWSGMSNASDNFGYQVGAEYFWAGTRMPGPEAVIEAGLAIAGRNCDVAVVASAQAGLYTDRRSTAPWTRTPNEFIETWGLHTAAEFALLAKRHMHMYGGTPEDMAYISSVIRNNGSRNPEAVYYGRGPFTPEDILASRMVADPYRLLDCAMTAEGGAAIVLTSLERARDLRKPPVRVLGGGTESWGPEYTYPPLLEQKGMLGRRSADIAFGHAGIARDDVDVLELYDNFSWEIVRSFEALGYCEVGEGRDFVRSGEIEIDGKYPIVTDGGLLSHSHTGQSQVLQRVNQAVRQLRGEASANQIANAEIALAFWQFGLVLLGKN